MRCSVTFLCTISVLLGTSIAASAYTVISTDFVARFDAGDTVADVTIVSARLHLFEFDGETLTCGRSYEAVVNESIAGSLSSGDLVEFTSRFWSPSEMQLRGGGATASGGTYLVELGNDYNPRDLRTYLEHSGSILDEAGEFRALDWGEAWASPAASDCLAGLPETTVGHMYKVGSTFRHFNEPRVYGQRWPSDREVVEYILLRWDFIVPAELVIGATASRSYAKVGEFDLEARSFLDHYGIWAPPDLPYKEGDFFLREVEPTGYSIHEHMVLYDELKNLIREAVGE